MTDLRVRIPVVAGLGFVERVRRLPSSFTASLVPEADHKYFHDAIAVVVNGDKVGYVAPEIARRCKASVAARQDTVTCPGRLAAHVDHETSGVELFLDFSGLALAEAD